MFNFVALVLFLVWFLVIFVVRSIIQKRATGDSGIRAGVLSDNTTIVETLAGWTLMIALIAGLAAPISSVMGLPVVIEGSGVRIIGIITVLIGIALTFISQVAMGKEWRIGIDKEEETGLVTQGIFGIVRNPIFSAMIFTATGFVFLVPNVISISAAILLVIAIELQVRYVEEPHLQNLHGLAYREYSAKVGRFFPNIGNISK